MATSADFFKYDFACLAADRWNYKLEELDPSADPRTTNGTINVDEAEFFRLLMGFPDDDAWRALPLQRGSNLQPL